MMFPTYTEFSQLIEPNKENPVSKLKKIIYYLFIIGFLSILYISIAMFSSNSIKKAYKLLNKYNSKI